MVQVITRYFIPRGHSLKFDAADLSHSIHVLDHATLLRSNTNAVRPGPVMDNANKILGVTRTGTIMLLIRCVINLLYSCFGSVADEQLACVHATQFESVRRSNVPYAKFYS